MTNPYDEMILSIAERDDDAMTGSEFASSIMNMLGPEREKAVFEQYRQGNVPDFMRRPISVSVSGAGHTVTYAALPDYLCVGSDENYLRTPMTPITAQKIAYLYRCSLPTRKMVNDIWRSSVIRLVPKSKSPGALMTSTSCFVEHNQNIQEQLAGTAHAMQLISGHKKDIVISSVQEKFPQNVVVYGWINPAGKVSQPLDPASRDQGYCDYSYGIRLVLRSILVNGEPADLHDTLVDTPVIPLLSDEGPINKPYYPV